MKLIDYEKNGTIRELFNKGVISVNHMTYFRYNRVFEAYLAKGLSRNKSYEYASDECGCSKRTIIIAVKTVNK